MNDLFHTGLQQQQQQQQQQQSGPSPILVIGAQGKTGGRVAQRLSARGYPVRGVSRSSSPVFDWRDPATWPAALAGVKAAYVTFYPDLAIPEAETRIRDFIDAARHAEIQHLVLLSGRGEPGAQRAEQQLMDSGLDWNIVRASWFMQNFSEGFMRDGILAGELQLPAGDVPEPFVDADDLAEVAVAALTRVELRNQLFELTGPRAMTFSSCVADISAAVGYPVAFRSVDIEAFLSELRQQGLPEDMLWLMKELFTVVLDGRNAKPTTGVERVLGRPATDFTAFAQKVADRGIWHRSGLLQQA